MKRIPDGADILNYWEDLVFLEAATLALPVTTPVSAPITALLDEFEEIQTVDLKTRRAVLHTRAVVRVDNMVLGESIRDLQSDTLNLTRQDYEAPQYRALFKADIATTVSYGFSRQLRVTLEIVKNLGLSLFEGNLREKFVPILQTLVNKGNETLEKLDAAQTQRKNTRLDQEEWKKRANDAREIAFADLIKVATVTKRRRAWADNFFLKVTSTRGSQADSPSDGDKGDAPDAPQPA